jgi:hypothetical protein
VTTKKRSSKLSWESVLTLVSGAVILGTFVAKDHLLEGASDRLRVLQSAKSNLKLMEGIQDGQLQTIQIMNRLQSKSNSSCAVPEDVSKFHTHIQAEVQSQCLSVASQDARFTLYNLDELDKIHALSTPQSSELEQLKKQFEQANQDSASFAFRLSGMPILGPANPNLTPSQVQELTSVTKDLGHAQFYLNDLLYRRVEPELDQEIEDTERRSRHVTLAIDLLFALGWLLTVGGKMAGTEAVIEAV